LPIDYVKKAEINKEDYEIFVDAIITLSPLMDNATRIKFQKIIYTIAKKVKPEIFKNYSLFTSFLKDKVTDFSLFRD